MKPKQQNLTEYTTTNEQHSIKHNKEVAVLEEIAREYLAEAKPEFELRVLDNKILTLVCMALEKRTTLTTKNLEDLRGATMKEVK